MNNLREFHRIEEQYKLFNLHTKDVPELWDILRVIVYNCFYIEGSDDGVLNKVNIIDRLKKNITNILNLPKLGRGKIIFFIYSRDVDADGFWYDKISKQLIDSCESNNRIVIELNTKSGKSKFSKFNLFLITLLTKLNTKKYNISDAEYDIIHTSFESVTCKPLLKSVLNTHYSAFIKYRKAMEFIFHVLRPKRVIISCDWQKGIISAAKRLNIQTIEMQHAGILFEYPSYSYPSSITSKSNIIFADKYVKFGTMWGNGMNIPCEQLVLGNDFLCPKNDYNANQINGNNILFVSTKIHRDILIPYCKLLASQDPKVNIIYKLHPTEFDFFEDTKQEFISFKNVTVISNEYPMDNLITKSQLVVLIYSSTFFEAISRNKKVAVIKERNSYILREFVESCANASYVSTIDDLNVMIKNPVYSDNKAFYSSYRPNIAKILLN